MTGNEYQILAMRTNDHRSENRLFQRVTWTDSNGNKPHDIAGILNGVLGLSGECGEFSDLIKKWIFHEKAIDEEHAMKELGDVLWYVAMICESFHWDMDEIMSMNIDKLRARYPEGFDVNKSNNRAKGDI